MRLPAFAFCLLLPATLALAQEATSDFTDVSCEGDYQHHLQGVCTDKSVSLFWSFTTELVKTDAKGKVLQSIPVENHHGDLCFHDGKIFVAVNLGRFNDPKGNADSWIYVYDANSLEFLSKHETEEVFHGGGGIDVRDGHFFVVGGLPDGVTENYVYEYDEKFIFVKKHVIESGWTQLGIQTAAWHDKAWWFGCYGSPKILLKTDAEFNLLGRYEFDCSLGIVGIAPDQFLVAKGPRTPEGRCRGTLHKARPHQTNGLVFDENLSLAQAEPIASVKKEVYVPNTIPNKAPWVWTYTGEPGYREEIHTVWSHDDQVKGYGDSPTLPHRRVSHDDGKTWTPLTPLPPLMTFLDKASVLDWKFCGMFDPASQRHVSLAIHHVRDMREGPPRKLFNHSFIRTSADGGKTFGPAQMLRYEDGGELDPDNILHPDYLFNNTGYPGQSIFKHSNGSLIVPVTNTNIPDDVEDEPVGRSIWPVKGGIGSLCYVGRWNQSEERYDWQAGKPVWISRDHAFNGLLEADVAELKDGRVLIVWRVTKNGKESPARKWFAVSEDGGLTFTQPAVFQYSDGSDFFSNSTFHRLFRSSKTGKLYWIGNIQPVNPTNPGHPRYPLIIAEVDEKTQGLIRETVTEIDTRQEGEGEMMQLSNFWIIESQEEKNLEIYLTRLYENPEELYTASVYLYTLSFP